MATSNYKFHHQNQRHHLTTTPNRPDNTFPHPRDTPYPHALINNGIRCQPVRLAHKQPDRDGTNLLLPTV
jgi:hypothetical protein